jgi:hypothetical protein
MGLKIDTNYESDVEGQRSGEIPAAVGIFPTPAFIGSEVLLGFRPVIGNIRTSVRMLSIQLQSYSPAGLVIT